MRRAILVLVVAAVGAGCLWLGERGARALERLLVERVGHGLEVLGLDWAELGADGLRLELRGHAPSAAEHDLALEAARATAPFAAVIDYTTIAQVPPAERVPIQLELMRDAGSLVMTGRFHGERMRTGLVGRLKATLPGLQVKDLTGVNAEKPGPGWGPELAVAARAVERIEDAYVRVAPGAVRVEGVARNAGQRDALTEELVALAGDKVRLTLGLREPPRAVAPFVFAASKEPSGGIRSRICHARDAEEAVQLEAALGRLGVVPGERRCMVALGGPDGDWVGAVEAGLEALGAIPEGTLRLEYRAVLLEGADAVPAAALERTRAALAEALPEGYALADSVSRSPASAGGGEADYHLEAGRSGGGANLRGLVPSETARRAIATYAQARLGPADVRLDTAPGDAGAPSGWEPAALALLDGLGRVVAGEATLRPGRIRLTGQVTAPAEAGRIHRDMALTAPAGYAVETALTVDLPAAVASVPLSSARCAAVLNAEIERRPIGFSPGDAVFESGSGEVLDRLAEVLGRCDRARIEVGGHTDNRGRAKMNQRLSRLRAEAILDALIARGVPLARLTARGYGEDEPVASNATEEGRARNRRIGFKAIECRTRQAGC